MGTDLSDEIKALEAKAAATSESLMSKANASSLRSLMSPNKAKTLKTVKERHAKEPTKVKGARIVEPLDEAARDHAPSARTGEEQ